MKWRRRSGKRGFAAQISLWLLKLILYFMLFSIGWVVLYKFVPIPTTATMIADSNGAKRQWRSMNKIAPDMARAVIAAEDSKFCTHNGFDREAIEKAIKYNNRGGRIRGGSTISQQAAKNAFLWQGGGYFRKGLEVWFTFLIEKIWGKRRIMEVYLNIAETGIGTYGVNAGAQRYFGVDARKLTRIQAARIAAVLPLPKKRGAKSPKGFTGRYGRTIAARIAVVKRDGLDSCLRN